VTLNGGDLGRRFLKLASKLGSRLFRQNTGMAWIGETVREWRDGGNSYRTIKNPRPFHAGIVGMSDLGGWSPLTITADLVGQTVAVYTAAEVKAGTDRLSTEQKDFIAAVLAAGGRAGVARNDEDLTKILSIRPSANN